MRFNLGLLGDFIVFLGLAAALAAKFIFFPVKMIEFYPSQMEIPYEDVRFQNEEGLTLHGWYFKGKKDTTLLYLHGNAGNIGDRLDKIQFLKRLGWSIFIFDYQGYGGSEGNPTIDGVLKDSEAAFRYLKEARKCPNEQIVLFGESLGGTLALHLSQSEPTAAVILESTFTSLRDVARQVYSFLPSFVVPDVYRSIDLIRHIKAPLLVIHGTNDEIVPFAMGKKLFDAAPHPKKLFAVPKAHHNDVYLTKLEYLKEIEEFLASTGLP